MDNYKPVEIDEFIGFQLVFKNDTFQVMIFSSQDCCEEII